MPVVLVCTDADSDGVERALDFAGTVRPVYVPVFRAGHRKAACITHEAAQELIDCVWIKLNDLNKARDAVSAEGFAGYSLFQNLIAGGQTPDGRDATNDLVVYVHRGIHACAASAAVAVGARLERDYAA